MKRSILDAQLQDMDAKILLMGILVYAALERSLQALQNRDQDVCSCIIASDQIIDDLRFTIERLSLRSLTLQQPLAGRDLRFLASIPLITGDLERIGDNATGIATVLMLMDPLRMEMKKKVGINPLVVANTSTQPPWDQTGMEYAIVNGLLDLGREACGMVQGTMHAFEQRDACAARKLWQEDDIVDVRYHQVRHDVMTMLAGIHTISALQHDSWIMQRMTYWLWIAHKLERVGDHCTNVCERIVFFLEGDGTISPQEPL